MSQAQSILLESGTNELEIVTYTVGENLFSINVMKVREIINPFPVTTVPESHHAVEGVVQVRGEILPVINLATALNLKSIKPLDQTKFIISELNQMKLFSVLMKCIVFNVFHGNKLMNQLHYLWD